MTGPLGISDTTASSSTSTGALTISGGLGILGNINFGGTIAGNGSGLTTLNASNLSSGTVPAARLGSGTANSSTILYGDNVFRAVPSGTTPVTTIATSGSSRTITFPATGNITYDVTLTANCTFTVAGGTAGELQTITLILRQDGTAGRVATLPASIKWPGGVIPTPNTAAGRIDVFRISTPDTGTTLIGGY